MFYLQHFLLRKFAPYTPPHLPKTNTVHLFQHRYDCVLHSKFRFRSATFFKRSRLELACEKHKDRILITGFRTISQPSPPLPPSSPLPAEAALMSATVEASEEQSDTENSSVVKNDPPTVIPRDSSVTTGEKSEGLLPPPPTTTITQQARQTQARRPTIDEPKPGPMPTSPTRASRPNTGIAEAAPGRSSTEEASLLPERLQGRLVMVVNCHLTGGHVPERRLRQVFDALDTVRKEATRVNAPAPTPSGKVKGAGGSRNGKKGANNTSTGQGGKTGTGGAPVDTVSVVVCGDMNSDGQTAVWELLTKGVLKASFREQGYPEVRLVSLACALELMQ